MHLSVMSKTRENSFFPVWVRQRELRQRVPVGHSDAFCKHLYSSISPCHSWGGGESSRNEHGGLLSLEFSRDGSLLVAGCENNSFLMFDPLSRRLIRTVHNAHESCIKIVKFLDSRIFATGSVDKTVSLWDARNLKSQIRTLRGHSSAIGNIEFSSKQDLLITFGVDGFITTWDMKNCVQTVDFCKKIFRSYVLLRLRLNPDESKMIMSTARGYLMILHELDLNTLAQDLDEFELEMIGFAFLEKPTSASCESWSRFLSRNRRRNRVEIVADFPNVGGFNLISALEIHPQGWSAFTRSTSQESGQEWTCVHDIQEKELSEVGAALGEDSGDEGFMCLQQGDARKTNRQRLERINEEPNTRWGMTDSDNRGSESAEICSSFNTAFGSELLQRTSGESFSVRSASSPGDTWLLNRGSRKGSEEDSVRTRSLPRDPCSEPCAPSELANTRNNQTTNQVQTKFVSSDSSDSLLDLSVYEGFPRLTHYIQEPFAKESYTESLSVSADGRLICSPMNLGIRLLSFSPECSEQSVSWCGTKPRRLHELGLHISHSDSVLCTKFSPRHCLLVSGCYGGKLAWYQPVV